MPLGCGRVSAEVAIAGMRRPIRRSGFIWIIWLDALDARAEALQLRMEAVVATLDMLDAAHARGAVSGERGEQIGCTSADVGHDEVGGAQRGRAAHDAGVQDVTLLEAALQLAEALMEEGGVRAHAVQLVGVAEAVVEDGLVDDGHAARLGEQDGEGLLPVGHEAGVNVGLQRDGLGGMVGAEEADAVVFDGEIQADAIEGVEEGEQRALVSAEQAHITFGEVGGDGERDGLVAVAEDGVLSAVETIHTLDHDLAVHTLLDDGAHLLQELDEVEDLRLDGGVLDDGDAVREGGGDEQGFGRHDAGEGQLDGGAGETAGAQVIEAITLLDDRAHLLQAGEVVVDGAGADAVAARSGDDSAAGAMQDGAGGEDGEAVLAPQLQRDDGVGDLRRAQRDDVVLRPVYLGAERAQHLLGDGDVAELARDVAQAAGVVGEQGGDHELGDSVLGAAETDLAMQGNAALDQIDGAAADLPGLRCVLHVTILDGCLLESAPLLHGVPLPGLSSVPMWETGD